MTQNTLILRALRKGRTLTPIDGLAIAGSLKLVSRICEIEKTGVKIVRGWRKVKRGKVRTYRLA